ncbi:hypothetical protein M758_2G124000 [Ceratodon purpureus]|nr:hypothetical protein M758_2G124000 [Ceratodon purpureus]
MSVLVIPKMYIKTALMFASQFAPYCRKHVLNLVPKIYSFICQTCSLEYGRVLLCGGSANKRHGYKVNLTSFCRDVSSMRVTGRGVLSNTQHRLQVISETGKSLRAVLSLA